MSDVTLTTFDEAIAWGDDWHERAKELARRVYQLEVELSTVRTERDVYKKGYGIAMSLAKPAPKFEQEPVEA